MALLQEQPLALLLVLMMMSTLGGAVDIDKLLRSRQSRSGSGSGPNRHNYFTCRGGGTIEGAYECEGDALIYSRTALEFQYFSFNLGALNWFVTRAQGNTFVLTEPPTDGGGRTEQSTCGFAPFAPRRTATCSNVNYNTMGTGPGTKVPLANLTDTSTIQLRFDKKCTGFSAIVYDQKELKSLEIPQNTADGPVLGTPFTIVANCVRKA